MHQCEILVDSTMTLRELFTPSASDLYQLIDNSRLELSNLAWARSATFDSTLEYIIKKRDSIDDFKGIFCEGRLAGVIEVRRRPLDWQLGYWLGSSFRGQGMMKKAVKFLCDHYADRSAITASIYAQNSTSRSIVEHAGLKPYNWDPQWVYYMRPRKQQ